MSPWLPSSPCGPGCLTPAAGRSGVRAARLTLRLAAVGTVLLAGLGAAMLVPVLPAAATGRIQCGWALGLLRASGIRLRRVGPAVPAGALVVGNHVSWLDVLALHAVAPVRMLAKREVRTWPLVGVMADRVGTVFLDRERLRDLPGAVATLADALRAGATVGVFPEGTTRCGRALGPFRPAAFQAALDAGAPVVPVALRYGRRDLPRDSTAAFVGDDTLWSSLCRVLGVRGLEIEVSVLPALHPAAVATSRPGRAASRRALARRGAAAIAGALPPEVPTLVTGPAGPGPDGRELDRAA